MYGDDDNGGRRHHGGFHSGPRTMHAAKCSDCGADCEVPFAPTEGRPVYCNACFQKHRKPRY
jgi:CxxC-x17-CxxC domain-containing protein